MVAKEYPLIALAHAHARWTLLFRHHIYGGKRVSLDPLRPTPLLAGLPQRVLTAVQESAK